MSSAEAENTVNRLRTEVLTGYFGTFGILPPISDIVRQYKTSRYFVEQAIRRLQKEGLLIIKNKRVFVAGISLEQQKQTVMVNKPAIIASPMCVQPFYVYTHSYPEDILAPDGHDLSGVVFYVGKGTIAQPHQAQRIDIHEREAQCLSDSQPLYSINRYTCNAIRWIWKQGKNVVKQIIFASEDELEVFDFESRMIRHFARPYLTNFQQNPFVKQRIFFS